MTAEILAFPQRRAPDVSARAADEHILVATEHRDRLQAAGGLAHAYIEFECVFAAIEGAAEFLRAEDPHLTHAGLARRLGEVVLHYCRTKLGVRE